MIQVDEALQILREAWASNGDYLDDLKERLTGSQPIPLVPFVGAGLSMPLGFPSWDGFLTRLAAECRDNPAHISEQVRAEVGGEERLAVLGGKDDMGEEVGKGVSHRLSPLWGSHILTQLLVARLTPWAILCRPSGPEMPSTRTVRRRNCRARLHPCRAGLLALPFA